jgi:peptidoglycan/xylan/chitin deacetylase (PgdA/CDA1 family)
MAASLYIVVEGEDPGFDIFVNGHALARYEDALERMAERLHVRPLLEFFSADENSMALLLEHGAGHPDWARHLPGPQWFSPVDGLLTIRALLDCFAGAPAALGSETPQVVRELAEYERVLHKTAQRNLRWHLAVSWR